MQYLKDKVNFGEDVQKGCGVLCDNNPMVSCIGCKKFKWHQKCFSENYSDFNVASKWLDQTKTTITQCPECEARMEVPPYARVLK